MRRGATFDSSFGVHLVSLDLVDFLLTDYALLCPSAVAKELGRENLSSRRLKTLLADKTILLATPGTEKIVLYGDGERAAINLALERHLLLLIDDWRPAEAARTAGVEVANTVAYLGQLYRQDRLTTEQVMAHLGYLARRGTLRPAWIQAAIKVIMEIRKKEPVQ